jgi:hypothetical protein
VTGRTVTGRMRDVLLALDVVLALAVVLALETVMVLGVVLGLDPDMGTALMISGHLSNQARSWSNLARDVLGWRGYASRGTMSSGCWSSSIPVIHTGYARNVRVLGNRYIDHRPCEEEIDPWTTPGLPLLDNSRPPTNLPVVSTTHIRTIAMEEGSSVMITVMAKCVGTDAYEFGGQDSDTELVHETHVRWSKGVCAPGTPFLKLHCTFTLEGFPGSDMEMICTCIRESVGRHMIVAVSPFACVPEQDGCPGDIAFNGEVPPAIVLVSVKPF